MKVLGLEIESKVFGWVGLVGYFMAYSLFYGGGQNVLMFAVPFYVAALSTFAWLYARKNQRSFGYWCVVGWQAIMMFYFVQGMMGL